MTASLAAVLLVAYVSLAQTSVSVGILVGLLALFLAASKAVAWARPKWHRTVDVVTIGRDTLIGREPIVDSLTGRELSPALPGIGERMESAERSQIETRDALRHIGKLLESQQAQDKRIDDHEGRIHSLELAVVERIVTKAESAAAWRAVEAVATNPDESDD